MTTYEKLEKKRIQKIRDLSLDEVKAYIDNLNKKMFQSFEENNPENVEYYSKKLSEVIDLTSHKWINLDVYSMGKKLDITSAKMIENDTKKQILFITYNSQILLLSDITLTARV